jgi:hypothetical protein
VQDAKPRRRIATPVWIALALLAGLLLLPIFPKYLFGPGFIFTNSEFNEMDNPFAVCDELGGNMTMLNDCFSTTSRAPFLFNLARRL